jgi:hypothetical protein
MRSALVIAVMVLSVVAVSVPSSSCEAGGKRDRRNRPPEAPAAGETVVLEEVLGVGKSAEEAETDALQRMCDQIGRMLTGQVGEQAWKPSPAFLRQTGATHLVGEPKKATLPGDGDNLVVRMGAELNPETLAQLQKQVRGLRMAERQRVAARGLAGVLAVLLVVFGYLKFEDMTKGYYTTLLRLTALAALIATSFCLWKVG